MSEGQNLPNTNGEESGSCHLQELSNQLGLPSQLKLLKELGRGGMGQVFLAEDLNLIRQLAIKVFSFSGASEEEMQKRFLQEAKVLASLDHANIVRVLSWGMTKDARPYTVMEYLEGKSLASEMGEGKRLSPSYFREIFSQLFSALEYAHERNLVHRDLKPSNVFLCAQEPVLLKLLDFGIVRFQEEGREDNKAITRTNMILGSPAYMSPEQCRGAKVNQSSDIYSLGVMMYEALSGDLPFKAASPMELMYKHMSETPASLAPLSKEPSAKRLALLVDRCLLKDPQARPASVREIKLEFDEIFQERLDTGKNFLKRESSGKRNAIRSYLLWLVFLVAALAIVLFANFFLQKYSSGQADKVVSADKELLEKKILASKRRSSALESQYHASKNAAEKADISEKVIPMLLDQAKYLIDLDKLDAAEKSLNSALGHCRDCDERSQRYRVLVCLSYAKLKLKSKDLVMAEKYLQDAVSCVNLLREDAECKLEAGEELAKLRIGKMDFGAAQEPIMMLIQAEASSRLARVFSCLKEKSDPRQPDALRALRLHCQIAGYFLSRLQANEQVSAELMSSMQELLTKIPLAEKNKDRKLCHVSYLLLAEYARKEGREDEGDKLEKQALEFN